MVGQSTRAPVDFQESTPLACHDLGQGSGHACVWAKLLQARAGARGPRLLVLWWWTVRERAGQSKAKQSNKKWVKGNPAWLREQPARATASRVERTENWTQQVDSQGSA